MVRLLLALWVFIYKMRNLLGGFFMLACWVSINKKRNSFGGLFFLRFGSDVRYPRKS